LWRAGLDPARPAGSLDTTECRRLHRHLRRTLDDLSEAGGSHTGRLQSARVRGGHCPKDGVELQRRTIGGRTTYSCPSHQH
jgi:formamidopyrimidine-DNA glycosylase